MPGEISRRTYSPSSKVWISAIWERSIRGDLGHPGFKGNSGWVIREVIRDTQDFTEELWTPSYQVDNLDLMGVEQG